MGEFLGYVGDLFLCIGVGFFLIGTLGVFRFYDLYTRLHALAKVDNLGFGAIVFGMLLKSDSFAVALKLVFLWLLVLLSSSTLSYILSSHADKNGEKPYLGGINNGD